MEVQTRRARDRRGRVGQVEQHRAQHIGIGLRRTIEADGHAVVGGRIEVIDHDHLVTEFDQLIDDERPDEPGSAGDENLHLYSGFGKSKRHPASHSLRWLPWAGMPPAPLIIFAMCIKFQVMNVVLRLVKSFSGPPEPSSR